MLIRTYFNSKIGSEEERKNGTNRTNRNGFGYY